MNELLDGFGFQKGARAASIAAVLALALAFAVSGAKAASRPLAVTAMPVPLSKEDPGQTRQGSLIYRGGLELMAEEREFGGISGLWVDGATSKAVMITDAGSWIDMDLILTEGRLTGVTGARIGPLLDANGRALRGKRAADAEGLDRTGDGFIVTFENDHKIWRYAALGSGAPFEASAQPLPLPEDFTGVPGNGALESVAVAGEAVILLTERALDAGGNTRGWIGASADGRLAWRPFSLATNKPYGPTDLAMVGAGTAIVLERAYSPFTGVQVQLRRLEGASLRPGGVAQGVVLAQFDRAQTIDNMEGLAVVAGPDGGTRIYLVSDDNFNRANQKTLLLAFDLAP